MEKYLDSINNSKIYLNENVVENSNTALILIHGLAEHSGRYLDFIEQLKLSSISVFAMDLRGHGKSIGKHGDAESIKKVLFDVNVVVNYVKQNYNFNKVGLFGHSVGGLVSALIAGENKNIDFLVLTSPAVYMPKKLKILNFIPYKILPFIKISKTYSESKTMLNVSAKDPLALNKMSLRTVGVFLVEGMQKLKKATVNCPTLLLYGGQDPLLSEAEKFKTFFEKINNNKKQLVCYNETKHRIVQNTNAAEHIRDIISWVKSL